MGRGCVLNCLCLSCSCSERLWLPRPPGPPSAPSIPAAGGGGSGGLGSLFPSCVFIPVLPPRSHVWPWV